MIVMGCDHTLITPMLSSLESWLIATPKWDHLIEKELSNLSLGGLEKTADMRLGGKLARHSLDKDTEQWSSLNWGQTKGAFREDYQDRE